jgi:hypothetical protein
MITAKAKSTVKIVKETASTWTSTNQYHRDNVNVAMGPRTGNRGTPEKRGDFVAAKAEREPLAATIMAAYGARDPDDYVDSRLESIRSTVKPHRFSR